MDGDWQVYVWRTKWMVDWSSGMGVAIARSLEEARALLSAEAVRNGHDGPDGKPLKYVATSIAEKPDMVWDIGPNAAYVEGGA